MADEREHDYAIEAATFADEQQFEWPDSGQPFIEDGRATGRHESFELSVIPGRDHLLVKAFDTYSKNQMVRVFVEKQLVGDWALPDGPGRYGEGAVRIPAELIGARREISVRVEFVSASIEFSFYYWLLPNRRYIMGDPAAIGSRASVSDAAQAVKLGPEPKHREAAAAQRRLAWLATAVLFYFILKVSWAAEDSYITLRTVDNVLNGYGLRWNVAERVQSYPPALDARVNPVQGRGAVIHAGVVHSLLAGELRGSGAPVPLRVQPIWHRDCVLRSWCLAVLHRLRHLGGRVRALVPAHRQLV